LSAASATAAAPAAHAPGTTVVVIVIVRSPTVPTAGTLLFLTHAREHPKKCILKRKRFLAIASRQ
jgi:hypothetical protein